MVILLTLLLITADGPKQTQIEMQTLEECWVRAEAIVAKTEAQGMDDAGIIGIGAGCVIINVTQGAGR